MKSFVRLVQCLFLAGLLATTAGVASPMPAAATGAIPAQFVQWQVTGEGPNQAALIVRYGDGSVQTRCVAFSEDQISGAELLERSGLAAVISPAGEICSIDGQGCPPDDCFCKCPFPDCEYWAYYWWEDGGWLYSQIGAESHTTVMNGTMEGWSWGPGNFSQGVEPPTMAFEEICPVSAATTAGTPIPAATATQTGEPVLLSQATPAPGLLAGASAGSTGTGSARERASGSAATSDGARQSLESRSFSSRLLPGYAAYIVTLGILLGIGWYVLRRTKASQATRNRKDVQGDRQLSHEARGVPNE